MYEVIIHLTNKKQFKRCVKGNGNIETLRDYIKDWPKLKYFFAEIDGVDYFFNPANIAYVTIEKIGKDK